MTKWTNPDFCFDMALALASGARKLVFLTEAPAHHPERPDHPLWVDPTTLVGEAEVSAAVEPGGAEDRWRVVYQPKNPNPARMAAVITHVAVIGYSPRFLAQRVLYVTTCAPLPVVVGQELTCAPFTLDMGNGPL